LISSGTGAAGACLIGKMVYGYNLKDIAEIKCPLVQALTKWSTE